MQLNNTKGLKGSVTVPGDKSISHRLVMLSSISEGTTKIRNFADGADCLASINCFRKMGAEIYREGDEVVIHGRGLYGLTAPEGMLDAKNSATLARLLTGMLAGQNFVSKLTGDASLKKRPMERIIKPLTAMGADISETGRKGRLPLVISGGKLHGIDCESDIPSAQVKSAVLLAGLYADGPTSYTEPCLSRDHTEILLRQFGADISLLRHKSSSRATVLIVPGRKLYGGEITVPSDISSAAYFIAAGLIVPDSEILVKNVGVNPTRAGIIKVCKKMGGAVFLLNEHTKNGEPICDILVRTSRLKGITIEGDVIPSLIDEIPVIAIMAAFAEGTTVIKDAAELKVKESNRIESVTKSLNAMGCKAKATDDGMAVEGVGALHGSVIHTCFDHRVAMAFSVAALAAQGTTTILDGDCVRVSYPKFYDALKRMCGGAPVA